MGTEILPDSVTVAAGLLILSADFLTTNAAMKGAFVGRNSSGVPSSGQPLGTALYEWGPVRTSGLIVDGVAVDVSQIVSPANRIVSGAVRTTSGQPQFLQADGAAATVNVLGNTTNLVLSINSVAVTVSTDIPETGLTTAPGSNNTCAINDTSFADQAESKYYGEVDSPKPIITLDTVGSEISSRVGQFIALKTSSNEIMWGWLKSATEFSNVKRGFFFDDSLAPIVRETIEDNDTLTLLETGWIFIENDGTTVDVTYLTPVYAYTAPGSPATSQYWYNMATRTWTRWSGSAFVDVNRVPVGLCVISTSNCIASRSFDFYGNFQTENTIDCEVFSDEIIRSVQRSNSVNVYGTELTIDDYPVEWDNTTDMETGGVAADTTYYLYISTQGEVKISTERPYDRTGDLRGKYHPYNNWRYICDARTDGSSDWLTVLSSSTFDSRSPSADFESKNLLLDVESTETVAGSYDSLSFLNSAYIPKFRFGGSPTWDITQHLMPGTSEKSSTWYWCWEDWLGKLLMVPDLTGTADANVLNSLSATGLTFQTDLVQVDDPIFQTTNGTEGFVKAVSSETVLTCKDKDGNDLDLFPNGNEDFIIRALSPVGMGAHKSRVGAAYNDGSGHLVNSFYTHAKKPKNYTSTNDFTLTINRSGPFNVDGKIDVFQVNDPLTGIGTWKIDFSFFANATPAFGTSATFTATGITNDGTRNQACTGGAQNATAHHYCDAIASTGTFTAAFANQTVNIFAMSGTVLQTIKPDFHT